MPASSIWNKSLLINPANLSSRRLSRLPKLRPHLYLPPHDVSIYMDANLRLRQPIRDFALSCVQELSLAVHPHPDRSCLYAEARHCIRQGIGGGESLIKKQISRYRLENFPQNYGLAENNFIIRKNNRKVNKFNDLWHDEYFAGSQRDQLSFMYCLWRSHLQPYWIWQSSRNNSYFKWQNHRSHPFK